MSYKTINNSFLIDNDADTLETARTLKSIYAQKRLISVDNSVLNAVAAAYKTASGLYSAVEGELTSNIYHMSKMSIATMIAKNDSSDTAFDRAAYELAKDAFRTNKLLENAKVLAAASGRDESVCTALIIKKLSVMSEKMTQRTARLLSASEVPASAEYVRDEIMKNGGKYLLSLPTAYGKTTVIHDAVIKHYINSGKKVLVISHRCSINKNIANIAGIVSYDECNTPDFLAEASGLKIVVNSLIKPIFADFIKSVDLVVIDEASQVISHVLGGSVKDSEKVWKTLEAVVRSTENVIMSDADINVRCAALIGDARIFKQAQAHDDITVTLAEQNHVRGLIVEAAEAGKNVLVACDVVKDATAIANYIAKKTGETPLVITAKNAAWKAQAAFIANPNSTAHKIVIYSPVITSALSITSGHFETNFGLFNGQIAPTDAIQMLRRDRNSKNFVIGIKASDYSKEEVLNVSFADFFERETLEKAKRTHLRATLEKLNFTNEMLENVINIEALIPESHKFLRLEFSHRSSEAWLKDNIANTLPATLVSQGFNVEVLEIDAELSKKGFVSNSAGRKAVKKEVASKLMAATAASEFTAKRVEKIGSKNDIEQFEVIRARAEKVIGKQDLKSRDTKLWLEGEGESKIANFRKLHSVDDEVFGVLKAKLDSLVSGSKMGVEATVELFDKLNTVKTEVIKHKLSISNAKSDQAKQASVVAIFKQLGLSLGKKDGGNTGNYYMLNEAVYLSMMEYLK